jgi:hypothetical protein
MPSKPNFAESQPTIGCDFLGELPPYIMFLYYAKPLRKTQLHNLDSPPVGLHLYQVACAVAVPSVYCRWHMFGFRGEPSRRF